MRYTINFKVAALTAVLVAGSSGVTRASDPYHAAKDREADARRAEQTRIDYHSRGVRLGEQHAAEAKRVGDLAMDQWMKEVVGSYGRPATGQYAAPQYGVPQYRPPVRNPDTVARYQELMRQAYASQSVSQYGAPAVPQSIGPLTPAEAAARNQELMRQAYANQSIGQYAAPVVPQYAPPQYAPPVVPQSIGPLTPAQSAARNAELMRQAYANQSIRR